uniref:Methyltransferase/helicase n=1 Tax=Austropuccinia psidii associated ssRNA virus 2 TaxID=3367765 RepID=A0AB74UJX0_9VIRU
MLDLVSFISESVERALDGLSLDPVDIPRVRAHLTKKAFESASIRKRFAYSLSDTRYTSRVEGETITVEKDPPTELVDPFPGKFIEPRFARIRKPKLLLMNARFRISDDAKLFFSNHFGQEVKISYVDQLPHDHAVAAISRRIEMDIMLEDLWQRGCDVLNCPKNYNYSVIDIGGDWRMADERKHYGMHVCAPLLNSRDESREVRKRILCPNPVINYCHKKFQECTATAPYAVSLHSCYDISHKDLIKGMLSRSVQLVVGTMLLPEQLSQFPIAKLDSYVDPLYDYVVEYTPGKTLMKYVPPALRKGLAKYVTAQQPDTVTYRFLNGASLPYVHEYQNLDMYSKSRSYKVKIENTEYSFEYKITRRAGSLIFFSMENTNSKVLPPCQKKVERVAPLPFNGYMIKVDPGLINSQNTILDGFQTLYIPRLLFDYVAAYCLTRVGAAEFSIDSVLAYTKSAMTKTKLNEYTVDLSTGEDSMDVLIATSVVAYKWAHDRIKLVNARVPHSAYLRIRDGTANEIITLLEKAVDTTSILNTVKSSMMDLLIHVVTRGKYTSLGEQLTAKAESMYSLITGTMSLGIVVLIDCSHMVVPIREAINDAQSLESNTVYFSLDIIKPVEIPEFPDYSNVLVTPRPRTRSLDRPSKTISNIVDAEIRAKQTPKATVGHELHLDSVKDFIELQKASQDETEDNVNVMLVKSLRYTENKVKFVTDIQALQKGVPVVMRVSGNQVIVIKTLDKGMIIAGSEEFDTMLEQYRHKRFGTLLMNGDVPETWVPVTFLLHKDPMPNKGTNIVYDIIYLPSFQVKNADLLKPLLTWVMDMPPCNMDQCSTILVDGVAGCGKTEEQSNEYIALLEKRFTPIALTATVVASSQVIERVTHKLAKKESHASHEILCMTIDSFLMHPRQWKLQCSHVLLDEALQMHAGKIIAVIELLSPKEVRGYGDSKQIGFINFSRMKSPAVNTQFSYGNVEIRNTTWRIPKGPRIKMLQDERLYGPSFNTNRTNLDQLLLIGTCNALPGLLSLNWIYSKLQLSRDQQLLILFYRAELADDYRTKFSVKRDFPQQMVEGSYNVAVSTIGESQGNDVDHCVLLRMSTRDEPLYNDSSQTIVALTRSKRSWSYLAVESLFPSMVENLLHSHSIKFENIR